MKWNNQPARYNISAGKQRDAEGSVEGTIDHPDQFSAHSSLVTMAKEGMVKLRQLYPGWNWAIQINEKGHVMHVFNLMLHDTWGYLIRHVEFEHEPSRDVFMRAGGEILERFGQKRGRFDYGRYMAWPRDLRGKLVPLLQGTRDAGSIKEMKKRDLNDRIAKAARDGTLHTHVDANGRVCVGLQ